MQEQNKKMAQPPKTRTQSPTQNLQKAPSPQQSPMPQQRPMVQQRPMAQPNTTRIPAGATSVQAQPKENKVLDSSLQKTILLWGFIIMGISAVMYIASIVVFLMILFNADTSLLTTGIIFFVIAFITGACCFALLLLAYKDRSSNVANNQNIAKPPVAPSMATITPHPQPQKPMVAPSQRPMQSKVPEVKAPTKEKKEKSAKKSSKTPKKEKTKIKKAK